MTIPTQGGKMQDPIFIVIVDAILDIIVSRNPNKPPLSKMFLSFPLTDFEIPVMMLVAK